MSVTSGFKMFQVFFLFEFSFGELVFVCELGATPAPRTREAVPRSRVRSLVRSEAVSTPDSRTETAGDSFLCPGKPIKSPFLLKNPSRVDFLTGLLGSEGATRRKDTAELFLKVKKSIFDEIRKPANGRCRPPENA